MPIFVNRMLSPTHRRIVAVEGGSNTAQQLRALGWRSYYGSAKVTEGFDGVCQSGGTVNPDPRNGWVIDGTDPNLTPKVPYDRPAGSVDQNPHALNL